MSDLTLLSPFELISAACINSNLGKFDTYVMLTSLFFIGALASVAIVYYVRVRVCMVDSAGAHEQTNPEQAAEVEGEQVEEEQDNEPSRRRRKEIFAEHMGVFLLLTFLAYPNLSKIQFESLDCSVEYDGKTYLRSVQFNNLWEHAHTSGAQVHIHWCV